MNYPRSSNLSIVATSTMIWINLAQQILPGFETKCHYVAVANKSLFVVLLSTLKFIAKNPSRKWRSEMCVNIEPSECDTKITVSTVSTKMYNIVRSPFMDRRTRKNRIPTLRPDTSSITISSSSSWFTFRASSLFYEIDTLDVQLDRVSMSSPREVQLHQEIMGSGLGSMQSHSLEARRGR